MRNDMACRNILSLAENRSELFPELPLESG